MIGVILIVALTLLLSALFAAGSVRIDEPPDWNPDELGNGEATATMAGNPWFGSQSDLIQMSNNEAGATGVTYRVNFTIQSGSDAVGDSLDSVHLEVTTGSPDMFSNTTLADLQEAGVDEGSDGTIDLDLTDDADGWQVLNNGTALEIAFSSNYSNGANDSIILIFEGVDNPKTAGTYDVFAETSQGDGNRHNGTITIVDRNQSVLERPSK